MTARKGIEIMKISMEEAKKFINEPNNESKIAELVIENFFSDDVSTESIGEYLSYVLNSVVKTEGEFNVFSEMLTAFQGYNIKSLIEQVKSGDRNHRVWESLC